MRSPIVVLLGGLVLASLVQAQATAPATQPAEADGGTTVVKRGDLSATLEFDGHFEPTESFEIRLRPKAYQGDLLIESAVTPGSPVRTGEKILVIQTREIARQLKTAENDLASAQANYSKAQADVQLGQAADTLAMKIQQNELSNAEAGLKWWEEVDGAHLLKTAELAVKSSRDSVEDQTDELEQLRKMYKSEELTNETADIVVKRALRARERAQINQGMQEARETKVKAFDYTTARQKLLFGIEQQKQALAELTAKQAQQSVVRQTALVSAQIALDKAQLKLDELKEDLQQFVVEAPFDGVVYAGEFNQGRWPGPAAAKGLRAEEKLQAGQVVMTLVPTGKLQLMIDVPENKLQFIEPGLTLRVIPLVAADAATTGTCGTPSPVPVPRDNMSAYPTPITLEKVDPRLAPGQKATARKDVEAKSVLLVPSTAIAKGRVKVKAAGGKPEWRDVVVGHSGGENTEIRAGLNEGDEVFTKADAK